MRFSSRQRELLSRLSTEATQVLEDQRQFLVREAATEITRRMEQSGVIHEGAGEEVPGQGLIASQQAVIANELRETFRLFPLQEESFGGLYAHSPSNELRRSGFGSDFSLFQPIASSRSPVTPISVKAMAIGATEPTSPPKAKARGQLCYPSPLLRVELLRNQHLEIFQVCIVMLCFLRGNIVCIHSCTECKTGAVSVQSASIFRSFRKPRDSVPSRSLPGFTVLAESNDSNRYSQVSFAFSGLCIPSIPGAAKE